ncbi:MAG: adenylate/guanylate cyclase domain-containing protein [Anaerolineae bacterium]|nr:adenylate/guanylate cyclase domain-containing protein [Anaerolineae bacterium]
MNLVPHFILQKFAAGETHGRLPAVVFFVDLSGFTPLTAALFQHQHDGAEVLSETLTQIFHPLVEAIYAWGGFISYFSGDAVTAVFPISTNAQEAASAAWQTAVAVQHHLSPGGQPRLFATRYGEFAIGAKAGLAAGELTWGIPGQENSYTYYFRGEAIDQAIAVAAKDGTVELHPSLLALAGWGTAVPEITTTTPLRSPSVPHSLAAPISHDMLRPFTAEAILEMPLQADFRTIAPCFSPFKHHQIAQCCMNSSPK